MNAPLLALVGLIYLWVSVNMLRAGSRPDALIWLGYSIAQVGFIWKYWPK